MKTNRPALRVALAIAASTAVLGVAAACGGGSDGDAATMSEPAAAVAEDAGGGAADEQAAVSGDLLGADRDGAATNLNGYTADNLDRASAEGAPAAAPEPMKRAVIAVGKLHVQATKLVGARHDAIAIVDRLEGTVDDEKSGSDDRGRLEQVDLTVRVPAESFTEAMDALAELGTLRDRSQNAKDVTTEVIDVAARVKAQRASVESIERLLARANTIGEIMSVEAQLTRRQAELDSLVQQQKFLADQTSMSTIHLLLDKPPKDVAEPEEDKDGFLGGLEDGWNALGDTVVALGTVLGAVLPFAGVLALIGVPVWFGYRKVRRDRPVTAEPEPGV